MSGPRINFVNAIYSGQRAKTHERKEHLEELKKSLGREPPPVTAAANLRKVLHFLQTVPHTLAQITLCVAEDLVVDLELEEELEKLGDWLQRADGGRTPLKVFRRPNGGLSFGSWFWLMEKETRQGDLFDFYILNEEDYVFLPPHFDREAARAWEAVDPGQVGYITFGGGDALYSGEGKIREKLTWNRGPEPSSSLAPTLRPPSSFYSGVREMKRDANYVFTTGVISRESWHRLRVEKAPAIAALCREQDYWLATCQFLALFSTSRPIVSLSAIYPGQIFLLYYGGEIWGLSRGKELESPAAFTLCIPTQMIDEEMRPLPLGKIDVWY